MSEWLGITNSRLYQARLLLDEAQQVPADSNDYLQQSRFQAFDLAALLVTHQAWQAYLHELAGMVSIRHPITDFNHLLECADLKTGEMQEIQNLLDQPSWLGEFLVSAQQPNQMHQSRTISPSSLARDASAANLIASSKQQVEDTGTAYWLRQLTLLIDQQRENRQES